MLGTNDTKSYLDRSPLEIGLGMGELIDIVQEGSGLGWYEYEDRAPQVLVISPPPLAAEIDPGAAESFEGGREKILELPAIYRAIAAGRVATHDLTSRSANGHGTPEGMSVPVGASVQRSFITDSRLVARGVRTLLARRLGELPKLLTELSGTQGPGAVESMRSLSRRS